MYKSLKYLLISCTVLAASQSIASTIPVFKVTPAMTSVTMAPGSSTTLGFTVSNNMAVDLKVTNIKPLSNMSNLKASITADTCTGVTLTKDNGNSCSVTASITSANVTTKQSGFFDVTACIDGGAQCSASRVKARFTIDPDATPTPPAPGNTTLTRSVENLALSSLGTGGASRTISITNTGGEATSNLAISNTALPTGTAISNNCSASLAGGDTCTVTITPGATASSDNMAAACTTGTVPVASVITVSADNATSVTSNVFVLGYGCQYQSGFLYSVDDTTATTGSIGGKVAGLKDAAATSSQEWTNSDATIGASSITDGAANTTVILGDNSCTGDTANCAAYKCRTDFTEGGYTDWYLPAICEMGPDSNGSGCASGTDNIVTNLSDLVGTTCTFGANCLAGYYWSSTEASNFPLGVAWNQDFSASSDQAVYGKGIQLGVRCSRALSL